MSISDELMWRYYEVLSDLSLDKIAKMREDVKNGLLHPKKAKERLALELTARFYNEEFAFIAKREFDNVFKSNRLPSDIERFEAEKGIWICRALVDTTT